MTSATVSGSVTEASHRLWRMKMFGFDSRAATRWKKFFSCLHQCTYDNYNLHSFLYFIKTTSCWKLSKELCLNKVPWNFYTLQKWPVGKQTCCYSNGSKRLHHSHCTDWITVFATWRQYMPWFLGPMWVCFPQTDRLVLQSFYRVHPCTQYPESHDFQQAGDSSEVHDKKCPWVNTILVIRKQLVEESYCLHQCRLGIGNKDKDICIQTELVYPPVHVRWHINAWTVQCTHMLNRA